MSPTSVYKITNTINGKVYYGKARDAYTRWHQHKWDANHGKTFPLHRALRKYGFEAFTFEVLKTHPTNQEACQHEIRLINSISEGLRYNVAKGGDGGLTMSVLQLEAQYAIQPGKYQEFTHLFNQGWALKQLGTHFGCSDNAVKSCAQRLGLSFIERRAQRKNRKNRDLLPSRSISRGRL